MNCKTCEFKTCLQGKGCHYSSAKLKTIKYGYLKCVEELEKQMRGNEYWEDLKKILGRV